MSTSNKQALPSSVYQGLDLTPAIISLLLMRYEYHPRQEVYDGHYFPTDELLQKFARQPPAYLTAIGSPSTPLYSKLPGLLTNISLLLPNQTVIFIGSVCDLRLTNSLFNQALTTFQSDSNKVATIKRLGKTIVSRDSWLCAITTLSELLTSPILTDALRRYFARYAPGLTDVPIKWLNDSNQSQAFAIHSEIRSRAAALANPPIESLSITDLNRRVKQDDFDDNLPRPLEE